MEATKNVHNFTFFNLQEFTMDTDGLDHLSSWVEFFRNNSNIRQLNLKFKYWSNDKFEMIAPYLQNLEEMTLPITIEHQSHDGVSNAAIIIDFMQHHEKLKRVEWNHCDVKKGDEKMYWEKLCDEWIISNLGQRIAFKRKSAI